MILAKLVRTLCIRMIPDVGIERLIQPIPNRIYKLPNETERFLLTRTLIDRMVKTYRSFFLEPIKNDSC